MSGADIIGRQVCYSGWLKLSVVSFRLPDGRTMRREIVEHGRSACVLPYDRERRTALLVRQFRAPLSLTEDDARLLEAIAGVTDGDETAATARREALEEAGVRLGDLEPVVCAWPSPGMLTERLQLYLAPYRAADRVAPGGGLAEEQEDIEVVEMPLADLAALADQGALTDMKTLALVQTLRVRHPQLFVEGAPS